MRRILLIALCWAVLGALAYLYLSKQDVPRPEAAVTASIQSGPIDRIWFSPSGELVGIGRNESTLVVRVWSPGTGTLNRERTVNLPAGAMPGFAVSADAAQAAWSDPGGVYIASLTAPDEKKPDGPRALRGVLISALAFTGSGKLAVLYKDGELEIRETGANRIVSSTHLDIEDPGLLAANGPYLAAYSSASGSAFVFDTTGEKFSLMEHKKSQRNIQTLALSPQGWFAVSSGETIELPGHSLGTPGRVRSLAFLERNRLLAGGDFPGIYVLGPDQGPQQLAAANAGTTALAATGSNIAFGGGGSLALGSLRMVESRGLSRTSMWILIGVFGVLSPLAIYLFRHRLGLMWKALDLPHSEAIVEPTVEGPIPSALIEACQSGDCILWAGSGLGAQAGLPTWSAFQRELAEWTAQREDQRLEVALHDFLRKRFRVISDVSQAHRLAKEVEFQAVVTTSLDNLLDRTFPFSGGRVYTAATCEELIKTAARRDFFLLKPFGDLDDPDTVRVGPAQCAEVIKENPAAAELMAELFSTRVFLFAGASLEGLEQDLATLGLAAPAGKKHYALVPTDGQGWEATAERLRQRYAIEPIPYAPSTAKHPEIAEFLGNLIELIRKRTYTPERYEG